MVDVSIDSLISMARKYIENRGVDKDKSGTINNDTELNMLLAGTGASSIEDLTAADIHKKVVERDTEKVFTTFMATENHEQAKKNIMLLSDCTKKIQETYRELHRGFDITFKLIEHSDTILHSISSTLEEGKIGQETVNDVIDSLENYENVIMSTLKQLHVINEEYKNTTGQDFPLMKEQMHYAEYAIIKIDEQIQTIENGSVPLEQVMTEIADGINQTHAAMKDIYELKEQYKDQCAKDLKFLDTLLCEQHKFAEGITDSTTKQDYSREFLSILIDETSPMTRNLVIQRAEEAYSPENDPKTTGINQNSAASNIKRSSYKTPTEIYTLRGNSVIVSDYSGKPLRTETLDSSVHKGFYE